jgi:hypothetical protein
VAEVKTRRALQIYSREKLDEFRGMPLEARLRWLEEANAFANAVLGPKRRALTDERFDGLPEPKTPPKS